MITELNAKTSEFLRVNFHKPGFLDVLPKAKITK